MLRRWPWRRRCSRTCRPGGRSPPSRGRRTTCARRRGWSGRSRFPRRRSSSCSRSASREDRVATAAP
uniref:Uncharacterized protein n=1 Tax=Arundo donax TaxID=35708 RepID=A0A0A9FB95_ARUDO